jgi:DNA topoisomerase-1
MPKHLVIVESPAKCSKIQSFLGQDYQVIASMGHIRALKEDLDAVGIERDFEAAYEFIKEKAKAIGQIKEAAKGREIILAADDDREGEFIAYSIAVLLKLDLKTTRRAVFHEITKTAVTTAIQNPRTLDMSRVHAQQSRAILDMLIGFTISPLLWKYVGGQGLSAGRCQTPALRIVVEREKEIQNFKSTSAWKVHGQWSYQTNEFPGDCMDDLDDEESARNFLENHVEETKALIKKATTKPTTENPPLPLITSSLQQQASTLFRSNPKQTMRIAQRLYEAGHITYMRTDKAILSEEFKKEAQSYVEKKYGTQYVSNSSKKIDKKEVQTQDAHEAIRPTHLELLELPQTEDWSNTDRKIYNLVWLRTIQSVMAQHKGEQRTIQFASDGAGEDFTWRSTWKRTLFQGWRIAAIKSDVEDEEDSKDWSLAESLQEGAIIHWKQLEARPHTTHAQQRFTEASLIRELEKRGIGRPSTFAALISTIIDKKYVEIKTTESVEQEIPHIKLPAPHMWPPTEETTKQKVGGEKDRLVPTALGTTALTFLLQQFDDLFLYSFTAQMESRLDMIADGKEDWKQILRDTWATYKKRYYDLKAGTANPTDTVGVTHRRELGGGLVAVISKKGPLLLKESEDKDKEKTIFYGWPAPTITLDSITEQQAADFCKLEEQKKKGEILGVYDGQPIVKRSGPYGEYVESKGLRVPFLADDTLEKIQGRLKTKEDAASGSKKIGMFEIRKGPYGYYMFKHEFTGPKRKFVSFPEGLNIDTITEAELIPVFQMGLQQKARASAYTNKPPGGQGGQGGGRGGQSWRGGGNRGKRGRGS